MMKAFRSQMKKEFYKNGKLKQYLISLGVNTQIDDDLFHQNENGKMVCDVIISFPDEFEKISNEHREGQSKIQSLEADIGDKDKTIKKLKDKLSAIDEDHQKKMENITQENNAKINELKEALHNKDLEIEKTKTKYEKEIGLFREEIQKEINALELYDEDKHMKIIDHEKEVKGIKDKIVRETIAHNDKINELEKGLTFGGFIRGKYKSSLKDLKEGVEHFQYIAQYSKTHENQVFNVKNKEDK